MPIWPYGTVAAIPPNRLYLFAKKDILASLQLASIPRRISPIRRNRHFFATVERLTAPVAGIFVMNGQRQTQKEKLACVAMFLVMSGRSFRAAGPTCLQ